MASYNKIILVGNLTRDPKLSYLPSQTPVCEIGLAVNNKWRDKDGQTREDVCFIDCRCYGRQAETLNQYMSKGGQILIEGRVELDQWETPDGQKRSKHRVFIQTFQFLDGGQGRGGQGGQGDQGGQGGGGYQQSAPSGGGGYQQSAPSGGGYQQPAGGQAPPPPAAPMPEPGGEDIPF